MIIDVQNDFCSPGGYMDHAGADLGILRKPIGGGVTGQIPFANLEKVAYDSRILQSGGEARYIGLKVFNPRDRDTWWPQGPPALSDFDFWLRSDGHRRNPGTTADLVAAALFLALWEGQVAPPWRL